MKKIFLVLFSVAVPWGLIVMSLMLASCDANASEYNFYFYGEEEKKEEKNPEARTSGRAQEEEPEYIHPVSIPVAVRQPRSLGWIWTPPENYVSVGVVGDTFSPADHGGYSAPSLLLRLKVLPIVTIEGAIPLKSHSERFKLYRLGALTEFQTGKVLSFNFGGGALYNDYADRDVPELDFDFSSDLFVPYNRPDRDKYGWYLGGGAKLRLFKRIDLSASVYASPSEISKDAFDSDTSSTDWFTSVGLSIVL